MWSGIKKAAALFFLMLAALPAGAEVIGQAMGTDIVSYINNYPVPSYNINGYTVVITSDLVNYGFSYSYDNSARRVDLYFNGATPTPKSFWRDRRTYGKPVANVLKTDIKAYINGIQVQSFNINGLTAIYFSSLNMFGPVTYDDELRAAFLNIPNMAGTAYATVEERADAVAEVRYYWSANGQNWSCTLNIPVSDYDLYAAVPRERYGRYNYAAYASDSGNLPYIKALSNGFTNISAEYSMTESERLNMVISFVQSFEYAEDRSAKGVDEYVNFPIETLFEKKGDCEDTAILLACILREMGYDAVLLRFPGHIAVGLKCGFSLKGTYYMYNNSRYYYIETTGPDWEIGTVPDGVSGGTAQIIDF
ncbi:MAG: transglutaminase domain-containing protein [Clostridia bacterium]